MGLLFDVNTTDQRSYPFSFAPVYSPTDSRQFQLQYTAPVIQIQSPNASVTDTKKANATATLSPDVRSSPVTSATPSNVNAPNDLIIIGLVALGAIFILTR